MNRTSGEIQSSNKVHAVSRVLRESERGHKAGIVKKAERKNSPAAATARQQAPAEATPLLKGLQPYDLTERSGRSQRPTRGLATPPVSIYDTQTALIWRERI